MDSQVSEKSGTVYFQNAQSGCAVLGVNSERGISMNKKKIMKGFMIAASTICLSLGGFAMSALAGEGVFTNSSTTRTEDGSICIRFDDIQLLLPGSWSGKIKMGLASEDKQVSFYQAKSRDLYTQDLGYPNGGHLFTIASSYEYDFTDLPAYQTIGTTADGLIYYVILPTDYQGYENNEEASNEYREMQSSLDWVIDNITLNSPAPSDNVVVTEGDYILPDSSDEYLDVSALSGMTADQVQMAINEIYARHHRRFVLKDVQDYFDAKDWYEGTISADDFDTSVMNDCEWANIDVMVKYIQDYSSASADVAVPSDQTKDLYGMIIEAGDSYLRVRQQDGSVIQVWYDSSRLSSMDLSASDLKVGAITSLIYETDDYEALSIMVW